MLATECSRLKRENERVSESLEQAVNGPAGLWSSSVYCICSNGNIVEKCRALEKEADSLSTKLQVDLSVNVVHFAPDNFPTVVGASVSQG